ncbi:MAG: acylphosphatase [ANME-2 cluster archaeon]|nr:acylphosphatase [ANME-2 cluster archaeon]
MVTGKVQDIGFRALIEDIARIYELRGFAFNDIDGSVKMVCCGENGDIDKFLGDLQARGSQKGILIDEVLKEVIPFQMYLPQKFLRLYTDELVDIGRKLDTGNEILKGIKNDTSALNAGFDSFAIEQREHNQWMKDYNLRLEKILGKIAEK